MEGEIRGARQDLPPRRPHDLIAGVVRDHEQTQLAVNELNANGFSADSIFVLQGAPGAESLRHRGEAAGFDAPNFHGARINRRQDDPSSATHRAGGLRRATQTRMT